MAPRTVLSADVRCSVHASVLYRAKQQSHRKREPQASHDARWAASTHLHVYLVLSRVLSHDLMAIEATSGVKKSAARGRLVDCETSICSPVLFASSRGVMIDRTHDVMIG